MTLHKNRAVVTGRLFFLLSLCLAGAFPAAAQRFFRVDAESKTLRSGVATVIDKEVYYTRGGDLNILWKKPGNIVFYSNTKPLGITTFYYPSTRESVALEPAMFKASDELLYQFAEGAAEDMGLTREGFVLKSTKKDGDYTVRRYEPRQGGTMCAWVEVAYDQSFLPVYCAYYDKKGKIITKTYLSHYTSVKGFSFPMRVTEISYMAEKNDSTVRLDIYKNLEIDVQREIHNFRIPRGAKPVDLKEGLMGILGK